MNKQLPERPNLDQLKKQAKDLLEDIRAQRPAALARVPENERAGFALHDAQRVVAREYGFTSWAKLKLHVETREIGIATARLVIAAANGDAASLGAILAERPGLGRQTISAAAVLGDLPGLRAWLEKNPEFAPAKGGICDTEALGYVCLGRLGGTESDRVACANFLLAHGADPNATWRDRDWPDGRLPILYAATGRNNYPTLAKSLLAAGANPNDGESIYHAAENNHAECLQALLDAGGDLSRRDAKWTNTPLYFLLGHVPGTRQAPIARAGIIWLLDHGADSNVTAYEKAEVPLHLAINNGWDLGLITRLLDCGADPNARRADGTSAYVFAVRAGRDDVVELLRQRGASADTTPGDSFLGACVSGRAEPASRLLAEHPEWRSELAPKVRQLGPGLAKENKAAAIALFAGLGFSMDAPGEAGERPLHWAAWHGRIDAVRALIAAGADLHKPDNNYHAPPLGWCVHGSLNCRAVGGDYGAVAEALLAAGAKPGGIGATPVPDNIGAPEVVAVLRRYEKAG